MDFSNYIIHIVPTVKVSSKIVLIKAVCSLYGINVLLN